MQWNSLEGASIVRPVYGVVAHGILKEAINPATQSQEEIKTNIETDNNVKVERVMLLMRKAKNPDAPSQSIVIFITCPKEADSLIHDRLWSGGNFHNIVRYNPQCQIKQCFNCQGFRHTADMCTRKTRCGKCAGDHETRQCNIDKVQCVHCNGPHEAWHRKCPSWEKEIVEQELRSMALPETYTGL